MNKHNGSDIHDDFYVQDSEAERMADAMLKRVRKSTRHIPMRSTPWYKQEVSFPLTSLAVTVMGLIFFTCALVFCL